jgi:hypothetical protein
MTPDDCRVALSRVREVCNTPHLRARLAALAAFLLAAGAIVYGTLAESRVECEACVDFEGAHACRTAVASSRDAAVSAAVRSACAVLSSGVTAGMACDRTPPRSVRCDP